MIEHTVSNSESVQQKPRALFFGMEGGFSAAVLAALLQSGIEIRAVVMPARPVIAGKPPIMQLREPARMLRNQLPIAGQLSHTSLTRLAWTHHIPVWEADRLAHSAVASILADYHPEVICVACFSQIIPRVLLDLPTLGSLNVHPSLLPANRGPVPLFWTFREGSESAGVTIHFMEERMDAGPILTQEPVALHDGITYGELERRCAIRGGSLLADTVWDVYKGQARSYVQDVTKSSSHSFPKETDFIIQPETWQARHAYNFIRGIRSWDTPITILLDGVPLVVTTALSYSLDKPDNAQRVQDPIHERYIECQSGWVHVLLADSG